MRKGDSLTVILMCYVRARWSQLYGENKSEFLTWKRRNSRLAPAPKPGSTPASAALSRAIWAMSFAMKIIMMASNGGWSGDSDHFITNWEFLFDWDAFTGPLLSISVTSEVSLDAVLIILVNVGLVVIHTIKFASFVAGNMAFSFSDRTRI